METLMGMDLVWNWLPTASTIAIVVLLLFGVQKFLERRATVLTGHQFRDQMILLSLTAVGVLMIILVIPMGDARRGQVLSLIGILLTATIALSSTTVLATPWPA